MLGWSLNLFRVRGIQLAVHSSFALLLAYAAWLGWTPSARDGNPGGLAGMFWNVLILSAFFTCVVLHELGHSFTAMRYGVGVRRILLMPIGGMAEFDSIPREPRRELLITLAGPAVNFVIAGALWAYVRTIPDAPAPPYFSVASFASTLFVANIAMGCFNLAPVFPMDGGRILRALLAFRKPYLRATFIASSIGKVLALLAIAAAVFAPELHWSDEPAYLIAALFAFIFVAGELEYRAVLRREREDAHWREVLARLHPPPRPADEPPVLLP